jgi:DNA-binding response OmpR family regulator
MNRVLVIDQDRATRERLGLDCLGQNVGVALAENLCEGVRVLLTLPVSMIVIDDTAMRLSTREHALLFEKVAPGVPVVVAMRAPAALDQRVTFELAGFRVIGKPVVVEDLQHKVTAVR